MKRKKKINAVNRFINIICNSYSFGKYILGKKY